MELPNVSNQDAKPEGSDSPSPNAQDAGQTQIPPTFTVGAEEVTVDAVVTDSKGHPVKGLSKDDFQVQETDNRSNLLLSVNCNSAVEPSNPAASVPPPPNVFNNNDNTTADQPMVVILLDFLNTEMADQQDAIQHLAKFLRTKPEGTKFALFLLTERLEMLQGFTRMRIFFSLLLGARARGQGFLPSSRRWIWKHSRGLQGAGPIQSRPGARCTKLHK